MELAAVLAPAGDEPDGLRVLPEDLDALSRQAERLGLLLEVYDECMKSLSIKGRRRASAEAIERSEHRREGGK